MAVDESSDGMDNVSDKEDFDITIIPDISDDLILAQLLHDQIVDSVRLVAINVALKSGEEGWDGTMSTGA